MNAFEAPGRTVAPTTDDLFLGGALTVLQPRNGYRAGTDAVLLASILTPETLGSGAVLDVGAGPGLWRDWFKKHRPDVRYVSTDVSAYACKKYGHEQRDISSWRASERFDLIVCQGVLPYLTDAACAKAIENLGAMARGFLYLEAITARDLRRVCDLDATDVEVHPRTGAWYRERLGAHFVTVGCGLYYAKRGGIRFYELEVQDGAQLEDDA